MKLEEAFAGLEDTIALLEREDITLEESFQAYKKGIDLIKQCNDTIDKIEKKVMLITDEGKVEEHQF